MKKIVLSIMAIALITGCSATNAITNDVQKGYINVNTSANTEVAPDVVEISFAIQTFDTKFMQKATLMNKEISDKVLAELAMLLDTSKGDYIKTSDFNASPIYTYSNGKRNLEKYQVSNRILVHTKSLDKIGNMIDKAINAGATNVENLNFSVSNYENQCNDLIVIATKKAQTRADLVAKALSSNIDGIKTFDTSCNANNFNSPRMYKAMNMLSAGAEDAISTTTTISGGVIKINANVNASFFVK